jgi:hypothetical protein
MKMGFDGGTKLEFHGAKVTSDGGFLAYHELDERSRVEPLRTFVRPGRARAGLTPPGRGFQQVSEFGHTLVPAIECVYSWPLSAVLNSRVKRLSKVSLSRSCGSTTAPETKRVLGLEGRQEQLELLARLLRSMGECVVGVLLDGDPTVEQQLLEALLDSPLGLSQGAQWQYYAEAGAGVLLEAETATETGAFVLATRELHRFGVHFT